MDHNTAVLQCARLWNHNISASAIHLPDSDTWYVATESDGYNALVRLYTVNQVTRWLRGESIAVSSNRDIDYRYIDRQFPNRGR